MYRFDYNQARALLAMDKLIIFDGTLCDLSIWETGLIISIWWKKKEWMRTKITLFIRTHFEKS